MKDIIEIIDNLINRVFSLEKKISTAVSITNAKLANMATKTYKGRTSAGTGVPEDVSVATLKTDLALNNVNNTSDANKPVSTAQQTALNLKAPLDSPVFTTKLTIPSYGTSEIQYGTGDGASMTSFNFALKSWWGIGFRGYDNAVSGYLDCRGGNLYLNGNVSASSFTDRTPFFEGDALSQIKKIKGNGNGEIDHTTLPEFTQKKVEHKHTDKKTKKEVIESVETGRDLGAMISMLTVAVQQITDRLEKLENKK